MISEVRKKAEKRSTEIIIFAVILAAGTAATTYNNTNILDAGTSSSDGLVAEYRFDTGAGNTAYDTSGNNDGTLENGADWAQGIKGKSVSLDGQDDYVSVPDSDRLDVGTGEVTVAAWAYLKEDSDGNNWMLFDKGTTQSGTYYLYSDGNNLRMTVKDGSNRYDATADPSIVPEDRWVFFTGVYDGSSVELWMNGNKVAETSAPSDLGSNQEPLWIGEYQGGGYYLDGLVDEARVYSEGLNKTQIQSLYNSGSWRIGTDTSNEDPSKVFEMSFQHRNSTHVFDTSGYSNHGEPQNGASQETAVNCKVGRCYSFDGNNDWIEVADSPSLDATEGVTMMMWVKGEPDGDYPRLIEKDENSAYEIFGGDSGNFQPWMRINGGGLHRGNLNTLPNDEWLHLTGTYDSDTGESKIYVNGELRSTDSISPQQINTNSETLRIATEESLSGSDKWDGKIDQVKIFNRSLSHGEIVDKTQGLSTDGIALKMQFNQNGGDFVKDSSIYNNPGRLKPNESFGPDRVQGISGNALKFERDSDDWVDLGEPESLKDENLEPNFTITAWVRFDKIDTGGQQSIIGKGSDGNNDNIDFWENNGQIGAYLDKSSGSATFYVDGEQGTDVSADKWHFVSMKLEGIDLADADGSAWGIGRHGERTSLERLLDGTVDNLKMHPYALKDSNIKEMYERGKAKISSTSERSSLEEGLVLSQTFDRIETCGQSDTVTCPSGLSGEVAVDESGGANHGELVNSPVKRGADDCRVGRCLEFDGINDYVDTPLSFDKSSFTYSGWVKPENPDRQGRTSDIIDSFDVADSSDWARLSYENGKAQFWVDSAGSGGGRTELKGGSVTTGWQHLVGVRNVNTGRLKLYLNGELVDMNPTKSNGVIAGAYNEVIGARTDGGFNEELKGILDQVRVYDRSLSSEEVWRLYAQGRDRSTSSNGPMKHFTGSSSLQSVTDRVGRDGTLGSDTSRETSDPDVTSGYIGTGLEFSDSDNEYVEVENPVDPTDASESMSVSFWLKPDSGTGNNALVEWSTGGGFDAHIWQYDSEDDFFFNPQGSCSSREATGVVKLDQWAHYTVLYEAPENEFRWYVDGKLVKSATESCQIDTSSDKLRLGKRVGDNRALDGKLDEVKIFPYALSEKQIREEASAGVKPGKSVYGIPNSCEEVQERSGTQVSGIRKIDPDGPGGQPPVDVYCGNSVDGGGWTLVYNYDHKGGTNPDVVEGKWPKSEGAFSHVDGISSYGFQSSDIEEVRFYCETSNHDRKVHYKTRDRDVVQGILDKSSTIGYESVANDSAKLAGHTGFLPDAAIKDTGDSEPGPSMFGPAFPMYKTGDYHWSIGEPNRGGNRWECDDLAGGPQHDTLHQIWVR